MFEHHNKRKPHLVYSDHPGRIAYLANCYPARTQPATLHEIRQLRACGMSIATASILRSDILQQQMPAAEAREASHTYYLEQKGAFGTLCTHLRCLWQRPRGWWRGLCLAGKQIMQGRQQCGASLAAFSKGILVGRWMQTQARTHLHVQFATSAANIGMYVKHIYGYTLSFAIHGPDEFECAEVGALQQKIASADFLICIGHFAKSQLMRISPPHFWHKMEIAPPGVDLLQYRRRRALPQTPAAPLILCVAGLTASKGQQVLLKAVQLLRASGRPFRLVLAGQGPELQDLQEMIALQQLQDWVQMVDIPNQEQLHQWYAQADIFVLPSFAEGIPMALMEAMACGLPCISSHIHGIPELIKNEEEGLLLPPADPLALARGLARLLDDANLRENMGRAARRRVAIDYDLERNCNRLYQLFLNRLADLR